MFQARSAAGYECRRSEPIDKSRTVDAASTGAVGDGPLTVDAYLKPLSFADLSFSFPSPLHAVLAQHRCFAAKPLRTSSSSATLAPATGQNVEDDTECSLCRPPSNERSSGSSSAASSDRRRRCCSCRRHRTATTSTSVHGPLRLTRSHRLALTCASTSGRWTLRDDVTAESILSFVGLADVGAAVGAYSPPHDVDATRENMRRSLCTSGVFEFKVASRDSEVRPLDPTSLTPDGVAAANIVASEELTADDLSDSTLKDDNNNNDDVGDINDEDGDNGDDDDDTVYYDDDELDEINTSDHDESFGDDAVFTAVTSSRGEGLEKSISTPEVRLLADDDDDAAATPTAATMATSKAFSHHVQLGSICSAAEDGYFSSCDSAASTLREPLNSNSGGIFSSCNVAKTVQSPLSYRFSTDTNFVSPAGSCTDRTLTDSSSGDDNDDDDDDVIFTTTTTTTEQHQRSPLTTTSASRSSASGSRSADCHRPERTYFVRRNSAVIRPRRLSSESRRFSFSHSPNRCGSTGRFAPVHGSSIQKSRRTAGTPPA